MKDKEPHGLCHISEVLDYMMSVKTRQVNDCRKIRIFHV